MSFLRTAPNSCVRTSVRVGLCSSSALTTGRSPTHCHTLCLLPLLKDSLSAPPLPSPPLTASPCERTPAPCPQCSVQQRRWSPSEPPSLAPQSHSGLVRQSPWQRWHWRKERWEGRKRGSDSPFQHYHVYIPLLQQHLCRCSAGGGELRNCP